MRPGGASTFRLISASQDFRSAAAADFQDELDALYRFFM